MTSIQMPQLGETIVEGTILKWLKAEGEAIERDEPLFEISTDKVDTEVPSPVSGTVSKILVEEGKTVPVGTPLAEIEDAGSGAGAAEATTSSPASAKAPEASEAAADDQGAAAREEPSAAPSTASPPSPPSPPSAAEPESSPDTGRPPTHSPPVPVGVGARSEMPPLDRGPRSQILSPLVRRLASEHGIDLSQVEGTGTGGRITKKDVQALVAAGGAAAPAASTHPSVAAAGQGGPLQAVPAPSMPATGAEEVVPMTHIRKAIAQHMLGSVQSTARAWTMVEVNVEDLVRLRARNKDDFERRYGVKLTYLPFVVRATIDALQAFPDVNARLDGENIVVHRYVNMGIAVSYDQGLIVPVIRGADGMNAVGISRAIADLAARARSHQLRPDEVQGATFTITNPGPFGSVASLPIINQPNTGILSLDAIQKRPVVVQDDAIAVRHMVYVSMSWDHRVIDGEVATRFLTRVKQNLETWDFAEDLGL
jgi:pyruvate dehydrogenase E2 component (dihydrolipoamide acetyltransferase)